MIYNICVSGCRRSASTLLFNIAKLCLKQGENCNLIPTVKINPFTEDINKQFVKHNSTHASVDGTYLFDTHALDEALSLKFDKILTCFRHPTDALYSSFRVFNPNKKIVAIFVKEYNKNLSIIRSQPPQMLSIPYPELQKKPENVVAKVFSYLINTEITQSEQNLILAVLANDKEKNLKTVPIRRNRLNKLLFRFIDKINKNASYADKSARYHYGHISNISSDEYTKKYGDIKDLIGNELYDLHLESISIYNELIIRY